MFLSSVVLPAPFAPTMATRLLRYTLQFTSSSTGALPPGYAKDRFSTLNTTFERLLTPSSWPGSGKVINGLSLALDLDREVLVMAAASDPTPPALRTLAADPRSPRSSTPPSLLLRSRLSRCRASWISPPSTSPPIASAFSSIALTMSRFMRGSTRLGRCDLKPGKPPPKVVSSWPSKWTMSVATSVRKS